MYDMYIHQLKSETRLVIAFKLHMRYICWLMPQIPKPFFFFAFNRIKCRQFECRFAAELTYEMISLKRFAYVRRSFKAKALIDAVID